VAFPTETVYGLGANVFDEDAVSKIFEAKMRPLDNPLIAHIGGREQLGRLARTVSDPAIKLMDAFFPGPLTIVFEKREEVPLSATAGLSTIGIRMPRNQLAQQFLAACETPVVAPSANLSGRPSPTTWQAVFEDLNGRIDCILQGDPTEIGLESTVVDCTRNHPIVLRLGGVTLDELRSVIPNTVSDFSAEIARRSPGLRHKHYSPGAIVVIVKAAEDLPKGSRLSAYIGLTDPRNEVELKCIASDVEQYARDLFEFFRECDRKGIETIYCESVPDEGLGGALMDRIQRAARG